MAFNTLKMLFSIMMPVSIPALIDNKNKKGETHSSFTVTQGSVNILEKYGSIFVYTTTVNGDDVTVYDGFNEEIFQSIKNHPPCLMEDALTIEKCMKWNLLDSKIKKGNNVFSATNPNEAFFSIQVTCDDGSTGKVNGRLQRAPQRLVVAHMKQLATSAKGKQQKKSFRGLAKEIQKLEPGGRNIITNDYIPKYRHNVITSIFFKTFIENKEIVSAVLPVSDKRDGYRIFPIFTDCKIHKENDDTDTCKEGECEEVQQQANAPQL